MTATFLTKEGFQKLQEELDHLRTAKRQEVADACTRQWKAAN